jgi:hypothetical protein
MGFDIKTPIGWLFSLYGTLLILYGALDDRAQYSRSLGVNLNVGWGVALLVFGTSLLIFRKRRP